MKKALQAFLQGLLGFENYLFLFAWFKARTFRLDKKEGDFFGLLDQLPKDSVVLDIGANLGFTTVLLAQHCSAGKVYAFEPIPENFRTLQKMIRWFKLKNVEAFNIALGDQEGQLEMVMPTKQNVKMQGLSHVLREGENPPEGSRYKVPVMKLDDFPPLTGEKISGIKIDVEEFEFSVLNGGKSLLEKYKPVVYAELWESDNRKNVFKLFKDLEYEIRTLENKKLIPFEAGMKKQNFFFIKK